MSVSIALAQLNPTVGDIAGNLARIRQARDEAAAQRPDLVLCPELSLVGYPPEDLVLRPAFVAAAARALKDLEAESTRGGPAVVVGLPWSHEGRLYNAAALVCDGRTQLTFKHELPNYGVFDEKRVFSRGPLPEPLDFRGMPIGIPICEDIWCDDVARHLGSRGARLLLVPNGSPFEVDKFHHRLELARRRAVEASCPVIYVNQVGGQDELVFDGGSFALARDGSVAHRSPFWRESIDLLRWHSDGSGELDRSLGGPEGPPLRTVADEARRSEGPPLRTVADEARRSEGPPLHTVAGETRRPEGPALETWTEEPRVPAIYNAMMLGLRDYVRKNGFRGIVLGFSGGIDSALTAAVAVDALGPDRVRGVRLPSRFTSAASQDDAAESARLLGMRLDTMSIEAPVSALEGALGSALAGLPRDTTEENIQARARGVLLMALSNKFGDLLVTTGNKSEMSVGYATLYGDMCGGYSVLKDVYKTEVYAIARWRNQHRPEGAHGPLGRVVPESSLTKAPTAELRPNQTDQDSLPPYDVLDAILRGLIEDETGIDELVARGFAHDVVTRVQRMLFAAEYKRRQAPPGVKITRKSFGRDRRYPMTNRFREG